MKIYCIQRYNYKKRFHSDEDDKWIFYGYTTDKKKAENFIKNSIQIEIKDVFGDSLIPKTYFKEYRVIELNKIL